METLYFFKPKFDRIHKNLNFNRISKNFFTTYADVATESGPDAFHVTHLTQVSAIVSSGCRESEVMEIV
jgi:hypothetical protein